MKCIKSYMQSIMGTWRIKIIILIRGKLLQRNVDTSTSLNICIFFLASFYLLFLLDLIQWFSHLLWKILLGALISHNFDIVTPLFYYLQYFLLVLF